MARTGTMSIEAKKWKKLYEGCFQRVHYHMDIIHKAKDDFNLETCPDCGYLKQIDSTCRRCALNEQQER